MRRLTFLLLCLFIGIGVATAQTMKITGNVISSEDQQPVIGAAVVVKGTTIGTVTDFEGNFSLDVPRDAKMIFISYVGLKTKEVPVASVINVVLDSDSKALDEVVVTAMGLTREKKALGYALQEVKSDELTKAGQQSLATSLSGKIAGVQITSQGGQVGASQNIVVRGNSSFGNNQPLIVVDGVPIANDNAKGATVNLGSGLNDINPEDIESISVLRVDLPLCMVCVPVMALSWLLLNPVRKTRVYLSLMRVISRLTGFIICLDCRISTDKAITLPSMIGRKRKRGDILAIIKLLPWRMVTIM